MRWNRAVFVACGIGIFAAGCAPRRADRADILEPSLALHIPPPSGQGPVTGVAIWQGWSMHWRYNHRLNRMGALLEQLPCRAEPGQGDALCRGRIIATAASGSGTDVAKLETYFAVAAARNVSAASAAHEFVVQGLEGDPLEVTQEVTIPVDARMTASSNLVALLSGFDAASLDSADKLVSFGIHLAPPVVSDAVARVPVTIRMVLDCKSKECPPMNFVSHSILVGVTLIAGSAEDMAVLPLSAKLGYSWDKKTELEPEALTANIQHGAQVGVGTAVGIRGFEVEVDREIHVLDLGLQVANPTAEALSAHLMTRNWRKGMKRARPPMSWFSYREEGEATWTADLVQLSFKNATVSQQVWRTSVLWKGLAKPSLAPEAERVRMVYWGIEP